MADTQVEYHEKFETAFQAEIAYVETRWREKEKRKKARKISFDSDDLRGLALSGGGIRSASFCMGVIQRLHVEGVMDRLHYMSTVSGGGFCGSALSWFLSRPADAQGRRFGTRPLNFPFTGGEPVGVRNATDDDLSKMDGPLDGRTVLDYVRQRSSYLNPGAGFTTISAIAIVLRSMLTSIFGFILLLATAFLLLFSVNAFHRTVGDLGVNMPKALAGVAETPLLTALAILPLIAVALSVVLYSLLTGFPQGSRTAYGLRRRYQNWAGKALAFSLALFLVALLNALIEAIGENGLRLPGNDLAALGATSTGLGAAGGILVRAIKGIPANLMMRLAIMLLPPVSLFLLVTGLGVIAHMLASYVIHQQRVLDLPFDLQVPLAVLLLLLGTFLYCIYTNINLTGLHRFYRDRIMETFMPDPDDIPRDGQAAETTADDMSLSEICGEDADGPYHLINTNVVLLGSNTARQRSRGGDNFVMSRLYCGSEATGFIRTQDWLPGPVSLAIARPHGPMTLPTAMAISGAALNPRAGADGQGMTKGGAVSALLNLLNLRLGYWVPSPRKAKEGFLHAAYRAPPNFIFPGLVQGLFGFRHNEDANWLELTDGGHFENTGIYELARRGVRTIIFADGSTDPDISLSSFANALEKIYIDFGVKVEFDDPDMHFTNLMKGTGTPQDIVARKLEFSKAGFAMGTIKYPSSPPGRLFYIKSTMIRDLPTALYSYKASNPLFPSESLADQFFSEQQFEAYRALGFAIAGTMVAEAGKDPHRTTSLGI